MKKNALTFWVLFSLFLPLALFPQSSGIAKDVVLVLDVSLSMEGKGKGSGNIFDLVKEEMGEIAKQLEPGDSVTLMNFGRSVFQDDRIAIRGEEDIEEVLEKIGRFKANSKWTYTSLMLSRLSKTLSDLSAENPSRKQIAFIFTDALDDPPLKGEKVNLGEEAERCESNESNGNRFVYYYSIRSETVTPDSYSVATELTDCFPEARFVTVTESAAEKLERLRNEALNDLIPRIELGAPSAKPVKPGQNFAGSLELVTNRLGEGFEIRVAVEGLGEKGENFVFSSETITLKEGYNRIDYGFETDARAKDGIDLSFAFEVVSAPSDGNSLYFFPDNVKRLDVAIPLDNLTLGEKMFLLPEYYLPLVALILLLLFGLYKLYLYVSFVPVLKLRYWLTPEGGDLRESDLKKTRQKMKRKTRRSNEGEPEEAIRAIEQPKEEIDLLEIEPGSYVIGPREDSEGMSAPDLVLPELAKGESIHLKRVGVKRKALLKCAGNWKRKVSRKEKFNGKSMKNGCYFNFSKYSFEIETNLTSK